MRAITLAVRGLWWRRGASAVIGLVSVVCVAVAAAGPAYAAAARNAVVQTTLRDASVGSAGLSIARKVVTPRPALDGLRGDVRHAFAGLVDRRQYLPAVQSIQGAVHVLGLDGRAEVTSPLVYRDGLCAHVTLTAGVCVSETEADAGGVLISENTARTQGWTVGTVLPFAEIRPSTGFPTLRVRGVYRPVDPSGGYWFAESHGYFGTTAATDAVFVAQRLWTVAPVPDGVTAALYADLALVPAAVDQDELDGLADRVQLATALLRQSPDAGEYGDIVTTNLPSVVYAAQKAADSVAAPVTSVVAQLLVLSFAVLFLLMIGSQESRGGEVALGKLRGLSTRAAVSHAVLEPTVLLAAAVPAGVALAALVLHTAAPSVLGPDVTVSVGAASWIAAGAAGAAGVLAGLVAGVAVLRRPVLAQWRRTERRPRRFGWIVEAVVVAVALGATSQLLAGGRSDTRFAFLPSAAPALFALAFALIGARVLPLVARAGFAVTRGSRFVGAFVALRQLARRQGGLRTFGVVGVAVAMVVFGVCSHVVFQDNRLARAVAEVGADRVVLLQPTAPGVDVAAIVDGLDPGGREATAVYQGLYVRGADDTLSTGGVDFGAPTSTTAPTLLVVDADRFAAVASWASGGGDGDLATALKPLQSATPTLVAVEGRTLRVSGTVAASSVGPVVLRAGLTDATGAAFDVLLGAVRTVPGPRGTAGAAVPFDFSVSVSRCDGRCLLRQFVVDGQPTAQAPLRIDARLTTVSTQAADGASTSLLEALSSTSWTGFDDTTTSVQKEEQPSPSVTLHITSDYPEGYPPYGFGLDVGLPATVPGLVTTSQGSAILGGAVSVTPGSASPLAVSPHEVTALPRAGDAGILVTTPWLTAAEPDGYDAFTPNQVWLSAAAPADFPARLAAAGLAVDTVETVADRAAVLARQGPSLAVAALGFGAASGALLAVAGAVATFVVTSRRRLYELAALRALGLRPRRIWFTVVSEQVVTAVVAAVFGVAAGLLGARIALQVLPEFGDTPSFPALVIALPVGESVLAAAAVALAVTVVTGALAAGLVRRADASRLRDSQG